MSLVKNVYSKYVYILKNSIGTTRLKTIYLCIYVCMYVMILTRLKTKGNIIRRERNKCIVIIVIVII